MPTLHQFLKNDIRITAQLFPWAIEKIRHWEEEVRAVSRLRRATFFMPQLLREVLARRRSTKSYSGQKPFEEESSTIIRSLMEPSTSDVCIYAGGLCE